MELKPLCPEGMPEKMEEIHRKFKERSKRKDYNKKFVNQQSSKD